MIEISELLIEETKENKKFAKKDIFLFNAAIELGNIDYFLNYVECYKKHSECIIYFTTSGGDINAAYKMGRYFQENYDNFTLCIYGHCKSAGTLVALGANDIIMGKFGEFGPLDVQVFNKDEFLNRTSGLAIQQSLDSISDKTFRLFEKIFVELREKSGGNITTQTASKIAKEMSIGLYSPITEKVDYERFGELQRALDVVLYYGFRLGVKEDIVKHLAMNYPCHSFVIDIFEAKGLFSNVREPDNNDIFLKNFIENWGKSRYGCDITRYPYINIVLDIKIEKLKKEVE